ncbi:MAG: FAD binding domain-containing protein [Candidatus Eisenbacteria bacterium]
MNGVLSYCKPATLEEALKLMATGRLTPIAGGTDLLIRTRQGRALDLLDTGRLGLDYVRLVVGSRAAAKGKKRPGTQWSTQRGAQGKTLEIGAACTHTALVESRIVRKHLPLLSEAANLIGSAQIRNRGTVGGNVVNASPSADTIPVLLNYDAELLLVSKSRRRRVKLDSFIEGPYVTRIEPNELLQSIFCECLPQGTGFSFIKLGRRAAVSISRMSVAVLLRINTRGAIDTVRVSASSVFPVTKRIAEVEQILAGKRPSRRLFREAGLLASDVMVKESGVRWSTPYKEPVLSRLLESALEQAFSRTAGARPLA